MYLMVYFKPFSPFSPVQVGEVGLDGQVSVVAVLVQDGEKRPWAFLAFPVDAASALWYTGPRKEAVSYTHLTLPTILRV